MQISFDWDGLNVDGQPVDPTDTAMFYLQFVNATDSVWYPPLAEDGIPNTPAVRESFEVSPEQAGLAPGAWRMYAYTVLIGETGDAVRSERSVGTDPFVLPKPLPTAPTNLSVVV